MKGAPSKAIFITGVVDCAQSRYSISKKRKLEVLATLPPAPSKIGAQWLYQSHKQEWRSALKHQWYSYYKVEWEYSEMERPGVHSKRRPNVKRKVTHHCWRSSRSSR